MKLRFCVWILFSLLISSCNRGSDNAAVAERSAIRGWSVLTNRAEEIMKAVSKIPAYEINHLQLSHDIIMNLHEVRNPVVRSGVNALIDSAHTAGVAEVVLWDHALYGLDYYPDRFKTGPRGTLDLDDPVFWEWFKDDYREMMALVPQADGLVLTFIETGARAEHQYSATMTAAQKLARVIDNVAEVVIHELGKKLYVRTFAYSDREYNVTVGSINHVKSQDIVLMMKETPHDFFLTHPNNRLIGSIDRPTIVEFDFGNEFNGQGVIANTWVDHVVKRWSELKTRPNVVGYVARTDRYGTTTAIDRPSEILLHTLKCLDEDRYADVDAIYDSFIAREYGAEAIPFLKPAFRSSFDIVTSTLYTLGTNVADHSRLDFDPYPSSYARHVSGKWVNPPVVHVKHDVDREFHYWKDVVQRLAPARLKRGGQLEEEAPYVLDSGWVSADERMDEEFLGYVLAEKAYGVRLASEALRKVEEARGVLDPERFHDIYHTFYRTFLTARLYEATAAAYWGYRVYARGEEYRTPSLEETIAKGLSGIIEVAQEMEAYGSDYPVGQWNWGKDREKALGYYRKITLGWPEYGGLSFAHETKRQ